MSAIPFKVTVKRIAKALGLRRDTFRRAISFKVMVERLSRALGLRRDTHAVAVAREDWIAAEKIGPRRFSAGTRPVIRWIKADGLDDVVTRAAIGQATRLFGGEVDYCLCTIGLGGDRVRKVLECASEPVEWWPLSEHDNPRLANCLRLVGCPPERFGYWWKWFPERVRPGAPEWILDGDMVITGKPAWFELWARGRDVLRVSQDDLCEPKLMYGRYVSEVDLELKLYSGLISLPPGLRYMEQVEEVLARQPLQKKHDGCRDMCEQGVIAAAFQRLRPLPIPLNEFPFGRAFENQLDYGKLGDLGRAWGYHFGHAFRRANPHFERLVAERVVFSMEAIDDVERFDWLGGKGQWGVPGWSNPAAFARLVRERAKVFKGRKVLEIGTSRGRMSAILASAGVRLTTVDHQDRGAAINLLGLDAKVVRQDVVTFLMADDSHFDLIVMDIHGNSVADWERYSAPLLKRLSPGGTLIANNYALHEIPEWWEEKGVAWFVRQLSPDWKIELDTSFAPGAAILTSP
jgi:hypothetical protein